MVEIPKEQLKNMMDADGKIKIVDGMPDDLKAAISVLNANNVNFFTPKDPLADAPEDEEDPLDGMSDEELESFDYSDDDEDEEIEDIDDKELDDGEIEDLKDIF